MMDFSQPFQTIGEEEQIVLLGNGLAPAPCTVFASETNTTPQDWPWGSGALNFDTLYFTLASPASVTLSWSFTILYPVTGYGPQLNLIDNTNSPTFPGPDNHIVVPAGGGNIPYTVADGTIPQTFTGEATVTLIAGSHRLQGFLYDLNPSHVTDSTFESSSLQACK